MGEELGEHYANKELRRPVREGAYRLALVAGVQPDNSAILFDHASSGLPQRFVWMPGFWPDAVLPEGPLEPPPPGPERSRWKAWHQVVPGSLDDTYVSGDKAWSPTDAADTKLQSPKKQKEPEATAVPVKEPLLVQYAPLVRREIERSHNRRLNEMRRKMAAGEDDPSDPDSHLLLTRAKVATLLSAWLDYTIVVSDEMWELAGWVIWVSNDTRGRTQSQLVRKAADKAQLRAAGQIATQRAVKDDAERNHNATYIKACDRALHLVTGASDWISTREIMKKMSSKERRDYREAGLDVADVLNDLALAGKVRTQETDRAGNPTTVWAAP